MAVIEIKEEEEEHDHDKAKLQRKLPKIGRRNIRPVREESKEMAEIQKKQQESMLALKRRIELSQETESSCSSSPKPIKRGRTSNNVAHAGTAGTAAITMPDNGRNDSSLSAEEGEIMEVDSSQEEVISHGVVADINIDSIGEPVLINPGHTEDQSDVFIPGFIGGNLKEHQIEGIQFMWQNVVMLSDHNSPQVDDAAEQQKESQRQKQLPQPQQQHGCILAHSMGLGKTLQTIAFVFTLLNEIHRNSSDFSNSTFKSRRVLIICPPTVQSNWASEFEKWTGVAHSTAASMARGSKGYVPSGPQIPDAFGMDSNYLRRSLDAVRRHSRMVIRQVVNFDTMRSSSMRLAAIKAWHDFGGVMIMGYRMFLNLMQTALSEGAPNADVNAVNGSEAQGLRRYLVDEGPSLVIADEGHCIKNSDTQLSRICKMLKTRARVCLTGYPLQNRLEEYWTMVDFCFPSFLGDLADFRNRYVHPINNGLYKDSTLTDKRRSTFYMRTLQRLLENVVHRRDSSLLFKQLPRKVEYFILCPLTDIQYQLYSGYLSQVAGIDETGSTGGSGNGSGKNIGLFSHGSVLLTICNHPAVFQASIDASKQQRKQTDAPSSIAERNSTPAINIDSEMVDDDIGASIDDSAVSRLVERDNQWVQDIYAQHLGQTTDNNDDGNGNSGQMLYRAGWSIKTLMAMHIIQTSRMHGERVLLFSRSIPTLDYLQRALADCGIGKASNDRTVVRIDGSTVVSKRQEMIDEFNQDDGKFRVFLISSGTGSIGINLVAASRVIIYDVGWNPLYDDQAVARAYRYGQKRRVYVYRLATADTWEEWLLQNNIFKVGLTRRVVDKQTMGRRVSKGDKQKYLRYPSREVGTISEKSVKELTESYKDDEVFCSLMSAFKQQTCKVTPQATLLANEDEAVDAEDMARFDAFVQQEKQRLGQVPVDIQGDSLTVSTPVSAISSVPAMTPVSASVSAPVVAPSTASISVSVAAPVMATVPTSVATPAILFAPVNAPVPAPAHIPAAVSASASTGLADQTTGNAHTAGVVEEAANTARKISSVKAFTIVAVTAMLHTVRDKIIRVQGQLDVAVNTSMYILVSSWLEHIEKYVDISAAGWKERSIQPIATIADRIKHIEMMYTLTPQLYYMSDEVMSKVLLNLNTKQ
ncbi:hypothetical protein FB639_002504 [Coemansia asiatica]|nr:hypothetical protein FB639_002504 [Coemansia asiatica]